MQDNHAEKLMRTTGEIPQSKPVELQFHPTPDKVSKRVVFSLDDYSQGFRLSYFRLFEIVNTEIKPDLHIAFHYVPDLWEVPHQKLEATRRAIAMIQGVDRVIVMSLPKKDIAIHLQTARATLGPDAEFIFCYNSLHVCSLVDEEEIKKSGFVVRDVSALTED